LAHDLPRPPRVEGQGTATQPRDAFLVGGNVPWIDCGWDFGPGPQGWRHVPPRDWSHVAAELARLKSMGIGLVRWWILAGGVNYPVGGGIEHIARKQRGLLGASWRLRPYAELPSLPPAFLQDFERLCQACIQAQVKLVPSLISFEWFGSIESGSRGRRDLVFGRAGEGGVHRDAISAFLDATLQPLLQVSAHHRDAIYAWEAINEPDWAVAGGPFHARFRRVSRAEMSLFIMAAVQRIVAAGFVATVGFKDMHAPWLLPGGKSELGRLAREGQYLHQLHHYPNLFDAPTLPDAACSPIHPVFVGELSNRQGSRKTPRNRAWKDPGLAERDEATFLYQRLELIRRRGYAGAWLWSTPLSTTRSEDGMSRWDDTTQRQVRNFVQGRPARDA
jgi:hypothetical protein